MLRLTTATHALLHSTSTCHVTGSPLGPPAPDSINYRMLNTDTLFNQDEQQLNNKSQALKTTLSIWKRNLEVDLLKKDSPVEEREKQKEYKLQRITRNDVKIKRFAHQRKEKKRKERQGKMR